MQDLIERLEKATGPDFALDRDIALATGWKHSVLHHEEGSDDYWNTPDGKCHGCHCRFFTMRIDDALTLIPEGSCWAVSHGDPDPQGYPRPYRATVMPPYGYAGRDATDHHDCPAIALCIAALKARSLLSSPISDVK